MLLTFNGKPMPLPATADKDVSRKTTKSLWTMYIIFQYQVITGANTSTNFSL